jgi:hypothetical protein
VNKGIEPDLQSGNGAVLAEDPISRSVYSATGGRGGGTTVARSESFQREHAGLDPAGIHAAYESADGWIGLHAIVSVHGYAGNEHAHGYETAQENFLHGFGPFLSVKTQPLGERAVVSAAAV